MCQKSGNSETAIILMAGVHLCLITTGGCSTHVSKLPGVYGQQREKCHACTQQEMGEEARQFALFISLVVDWPGSRFHPWKTWEQYLMSFRT